MRLLPLPPLRGAGASAGPATYLSTGALALVAAALLLPSPAAAETVNGSVKITDQAYVPQVVTIKPGETVTWFNAGRVDHTVTSNSGTQMSSGGIEPGNEVSIRFQKPGTYAYHSEFLRDHLRGVVVVSGQPTPKVVTVTVTEPATTPPYRITLPPETLRNLSPNPLLVRLSRGDEDDTGQQIGLVVAAGVTVAAGIVGLVLLGRRRTPRSDV